MHIIGHTNIQSDYKIEIKTMIIQNLNTCSLHPTIIVHKQIYI